MTNANPEGVNKWDDDGEQSCVLIQDADLTLPLL